MYYIVQTVIMRVVQWWYVYIEWILCKHAADLHFEEGVALWQSVHL